MAKKGNNKRFALQWQKKIKNTTICTTLVVLTFVVIFLYNGKMFLIKRYSKVLRGSVPAGRFFKSAPWPRAALGAS